MKRYLLVIGLLMAWLLASAQLTYKVTDIGPMHLVQQLSPQDEVTDFYPVFVYHLSLIHISEPRDRG